jgi:hypothetical protein
VGLKQLYQCSKNHFSDGIPTHQNLEKAMQECDVSKPMYEFGLQNGHIIMA